MNNVVRVFLLLATLSPCVTAFSRTPIALRGHHSFSSKDVGHTSLRLGLPSLVEAEDDPIDKKMVERGEGGLAGAGANSFGEYLLPYAGLVLFAFLLAGGAFALLVLTG
jgi:hypothetical protein